MVRRAPRPSHPARRAPLALAGIVVSTVAASAATPALAPLLVGGGTLDAQGVRIRGTTTSRYLELRPFVDDSVPIGAAPGTGGYRTTADGIVVRCTEPETVCRFKRSGARASSVPVLQDLELTAWGLGRGVSFHATGRARAGFGSVPELWPRATDRFDALEAYLRYDGTRGGAKLGRQWVTSGLGVYNFDGASVVARPARWLTLDAWGGQALARGTNEPYVSSEIAAVEELPPDRNALLFGGAVQVRPTRRSAVRAMWQRELRANRSGLYSDRIAADGVLRFDRGELDADYEIDLASGQVNEVRLRGRRDLPARTSLTVEGRRFRPFFELWTIWGAFSPVGFDEARTDLGWTTRDRRLALNARGAYRVWQDAEAGLDFQPLRTQGWRLGGDALWRASPRWLASARYDADVGAGAARSEGDVGVRWEPGDRVYIGALVSAWQSIFEFRVGTERVYGFGLDAGVRLRPDLRVVGDVATYRTDASRSALTTDWNQRRATLRLEWSVGGDPGAPALPRARRAW